MFGAVLTGSPSTSTAINDVFTFTILGGPALTDAQVSTILRSDTQNVNFSSALLHSTFAFTKTSNDLISVLGTLLAETGFHSGTINVQVAPVPEPGTWAMMLLGSAQWVS